MPARADPTADDETIPLEDEEEEDDEDEEDDDATRLRSTRDRCGSTDERARLCWRNEATALLVLLLAPLALGLKLTINELNS